MSNDRIYTRQEICRSSGIDYSRLMYHIRLGNIPMGVQWGGTYAYTQEELDAVVEFMTSRKKYSRTKLKQMQTHTN